MSEPEGVYGAININPFIGLDLGGGLSESRAGLLAAKAKVYDLVAAWTGCIRLLDYSDFG